jgi:hypothetical protein
MLSYVSRKVPLDRSWYHGPVEVMRLIPVAVDVAKNAIHVPPLFPAVAAV